MSKSILTGIKPTGEPHIGNYFGSIKPAIEKASEFDSSNYFIADYHALNTFENPEAQMQSTLKIAAAWLAAGLDTGKTNLYRQSDIPQLFELSTVLAAFTPKGWMNKAHAYKAANDQNQLQDRELDHDVNMGLFSYPILMAADILLFDTDVVPVGKDQTQHVELARDIAQRFNTSVGSDVFILPELSLEQDLEIVLGVDGQKMSKSYGNTIPLFGGAEVWKASISKIVTDSSQPDEPKTFENTAFDSILKAVASQNNYQELRAKLENGQQGWGDAKNRLTEIFIERFNEMNKKYDELISSPETIKQLLESGAQTIRPQAEQKMSQVRQALGIN